MMTHHFWPALMSFLLMFLVSTCWATVPASGNKSAILHENDPEDLFVTVRRLDSLLFDAFNHRQYDALKSMISPQIEFYHDKGGLTLYEQTMESFARLFERVDAPTRSLVPGTLEVYPIPGYGAIEVGQHEFCHTENGKPVCGTFRFLHIWQQTDDQWQLMRVVSYGH